MKHGPTIRNISRKAEEYQTQCVLDGKSKIERKSFGELLDLAYTAKAKKGIALPNRFNAYEAPVYKGTRDNPSPPIRAGSLAAFSIPSLGGDTNRLPRSGA